MGSLKIDLDAIGQSRNTDKSSLFRDPRDGEIKIGNEYLRHYDGQLSPIRTDAILLIELGNGYGAEAGNSLRMWDEYFSHRKTRIVGVDIESVHKGLEGDRINIEIGDCGSADFLETIGSKYPDADVIIDDASHYWVHQCLAFNVLFRTLKPGGLYIVEDLGTSFGDEVREIYGAPGGPDMYSLLLAYATQVVGNGFPTPVARTLPTDVIVKAVANMIDSFTMVRGAVMIRKKVA